MGGDESSTPVPENSIRVTRAHLADLRRIRDNEAREWGEQSSTALLDQLIAAAEADSPPPLPEGWYVFESVMHGNLHVYVRGEKVYTSDSCSCASCVWEDHVGDYAHRLSPLPSGVSEAQVQEVVEDDVLWSHPMSDDAHANRRRLLDGALALLGIEVVGRG